MRPQDLRSFVRRDWARKEEAKLDYWVELTSADGPVAALSAADALREHVARFAASDYVRSRAEDLAHHVALKRRIDAANQRLGR
jgi:hypothetical protein